ncbi:MAG: DNA polymerase [Patescibacteria group bacterium]
MNKLVKSNTKVKTKNKNSKKLILLDAHAIIHRAYHALPDFQNSAGVPTGALYGIAAMLVKIINELKPDYLVACYDRAEATFRKQIYDDYKAGRAKTEDNLVAQLESSRELFTSFNIPIYDLAGFEADDMIGTIVEQIKQDKTQKNTQVIIASGDMDTLQLVDDEKVVVYTLKKGINDTILYDEQKVVERFGFKPELLPDWKGLRGDPSDNIIGIAGIGEKTATILITKFGKLEEIYKKLKDKKVEKENFKIFREAGLTDRIIKLLKDGEEEAIFSKTLATIRRDAGIKFVWPEKVWRESVDLEKVDELFKKLEFRTLGTRVRSALSGEAVISAKTPAKPEPEILESELAIAVGLLDSEVGSAPTREDLERLGGEEKVLAELKKTNLQKVYENIELPLVAILEKAQEHGILVDVKYLKKLSEQYHAEQTEIEQRIYKTVGQEFNLNSPKQLAEILFDKLMLKTGKKTAGGARSTKESELIKLQDSHPVIADILAYRELQKLLSTYIDSLPNLVDKNGRLHSKLHQLGAATGRMSSSDPNLQNIPASGERATEIRRAFLASPGYAWCACDYSQIEMRVLAALSGDQELIRIFNAGEDVHTSVAVRVFKVKPENVTKEMRRRAKVINFGIVYGMGVNALKANLGTSRDEAQKFYDDYFANFPSIQNYFEEVKTNARKLGYTETFFGRRRYFSGLKSSLPFVRAMNERMAVNAPLQGTAADIVKIAMREVDELIQKNKWQDSVHLLLQVHDELIYEIKSEKVDEILPQIKQAMENVKGLSVPLVATAGSGPNWAEVR